MKNDTLVNVTICAIVALVIFAVWYLMTGNDSLMQLFFKAMG